VNEDPSPEPGAEAAMARVLAAEQAARSAIEGARLEAAAIAEQARTEARALAERTQGRIVKARLAFARQLQSELARMEAQACALGGASEPSPEELQRLRRAVPALAEQLTGGSQ
jgi:hypothetical protein